MPKSKSKRSRYQPPPKPKPKPSPRWYGPLVLGVAVAGVIIIVLNYLGIMPTSSGGASNLWLWVGLGTIATAFIGLTQLR